MIAPTRWVILTARCWAVRETEAEVQADSKTVCEVGDWRPEELELVRAAEKLAGDDRLTWRRVQRLLRLLEIAMLTGG